MNDLLEAAKLLQDASLKLLASAEKLETMLKGEQATSQEQSNPPIPPPVANSEGRKCPKCGKALIMRTNTRTKDPFLGCPGYPDCKYAEPITKTPATPPQKVEEPEGSLDY